MQLRTLKLHHPAFNVFLSVYCSHCSCQWKERTHPVNFWYLGTCSDRARKKKKKTTMISQSIQKILGKWIPIITACRNYQSQITVGHCILTTSLWWWWLVPRWKVVVRRLNNTFRYNLIGVPHERALFETVNVAAQLRDSMLLNWSTQISFWNGFLIIWSF